MTFTRKLGVGTVLAAILLPPLGVWINRGIGPAFWASLALTALGYIPGVIFALIAILTPTLLPNRV